MASPRKTLRRCLKRLLFCIPLIPVSLFADTFVGGSITTNTTWTLSGSPYIVTSNVIVDGSGGNITLTIEPGVVVKFNTGTSLKVGTVGFATYIKAVGTPSAPIVFDANTPSPTPGFWAGLTLGASIIPTELAWVKVKHATTGLTLSGFTTLDPALAAIVRNSTFENNSVAGMSGRVGIMYQNSLIGNTSGLTWTGTSCCMDARLFWWNSADGPSGAGPGSGQSVATNVNYEPWLTATPTVTHYFKSFSILNRIFNPTIGAKTTLNFGTSLTGNWTVTVRNSINQVLKTFTGSGQTESVIWDGKDSLGVIQPNGTYNYTLESTAPGSETATPAKGLVTIDSTKQLVMSNLATDTAWIETGAVKITATFNYDDTNWTINFKNSVGTIVFSTTGQGSSITYFWYGKDYSGTNVPDGPYTIEVIGTVGTSTVTGTKTVTVDRTQPVAIIHTPTEGEVISNVYGTGLNGIPVTITASDANPISWVVEFRRDDAPTQWWQVANGTTNVASSTVGTVGPLNGINGNYTVRLSITYPAGGFSPLTAYRHFKIQNFLVTKTTEEGNPVAGNVTVYQSTVPFTLNETLLIKNASGQTIRTLVNNVQRGVGTYNDAWNGKNDQNANVPDGPYFWIVTATQGSNSVAIDLTNQFYTPDVSTNGTQTEFDPFNNQPLAIAYNFASPGQPKRITIVFSPLAWGTLDCNPPNFCPVVDKYEESGAHTYRWAGVDPSGAFRPDITYTKIFGKRTNISKNTVVLYGTKPAISNFSAIPPVRTTTFGSQNLTFNLTTFQNQTVNITITIVNQTSLTTLRTITSNNVSPGAISIPWDGKSDNGIHVSPGRYTITVTAVDGMGNQVSEQTLTTVQF